MFSSEKAATGDGSMMSQSILSMFYPHQKRTIMISLKIAQIIDQFYRGFRKFFDIFIFGYAPLSLYLRNIFCSTWYTLEERKFAYIASAVTLCEIYFRNRSCFFSESRSSEEICGSNQEIVVSKSEFLLSVRHFLHEI